MTHDALARDLADHLRSELRMTWCDLQLGPSGSVRPDVYTIMRSYIHPAPMAYECKVSVADFIGDVTSGKWQTYLKYACGVYFAVEAGPITKNDVPDHCGLIIKRGDNWRVAKKPVLSPVTIPQDALIKLLIDGVHREGPLYRRKVWSESQYVEQFKTKFGEVTARTIRDRLSVEKEVLDCQRQADRIVVVARQRAEEISKEAVDKFAPLRNELCAALGLEPTTDRYQIERAVRVLRESLAEHPANRKLRTLTQSLHHALDRDGWKEDVTEHEDG